MQIVGVCIVSHLHSVIYTSLHVNTNNANKQIGSKTYADKDTEIFILFIKLLPYSKDMQM